MEASIVDLRYRMKEILNALNRKETVRVLYHGKLCGTIIPPNADNKKKSAREHEFFGCRKDTNETVAETMKKIRRRRYHDI